MDAHTHAYSRYRIIKNYKKNGGMGMGMVGLSDTFIHTSNHPTLTKQHAPPLFREGVGVTGSNDMT